MWLGSHEWHIQTLDIISFLPQAVATRGKFCSPNHPDKVHPRICKGLISLALNSPTGPLHLGLLEEESGGEMSLLPDSVW